MSNLLSTYTNSGPVAGGGGGGGNTTTVVETAPYTFGFASVTASAGTETLVGVSIPAASTLLSIDFTIVTPFSYVAWGATNYVQTPLLISTDSQYSAPLVSGWYLSPWASVEPIANESFNVGVQNSTVARPRIGLSQVIGAGAAVPIAEWVGWSQFVGGGGSNELTAGEIEITFTYMTIV